MNVVFWSSMPGMSAVSSSLLATALATAAVHKVKCSVTQLQYKNNGLFSSVITSSDSDSILHFENVGIDALMRLACGGEPGTGDAVMDVGFAYISGNLNLFVESKQENELVYKNDLIPMIPNMFDIMQEAFRVNFIDVPAGINDYSREALTHADVIVVCLPSSRVVVERFFAECDFPKEKLFILLGDYHEGSNVSPRTIHNQYKSRTSIKQMSCIKHCTEYANAMNLSKSVSFFLSNLNSTKGDSCRAFIDSCNETAGKILSLCGVRGRT